MGGVCCPTLISNTALAEKFTSYFHGFLYKSFPLTRCCLIRLLATRQTTNYYPLGGVFLHINHPLSFCLSYYFTELNVSAQSASW